MKFEGGVVLVTGSARRIGALIARQCHKQGMKVILHYNTSKSQAFALCGDLNELQPDSAVVVQHDLLNVGDLDKFVKEVTGKWGRLDVLVNNASSFYSTPFGHITVSQWDELMGSNVKGAFFLSQALAPELQKSQGTIINIADIHGRAPLSGYGPYCIAKAGLLMATKVLAKELAPSVRVNAIAPGAILWPEGESAVDESKKQRIIDKTLMKRHGDPTDIANMVWFLIHEAAYMTGQVIAVDGGRSVAYG